MPVLKQNKREKSGGVIPLEKRHASKIEGGRNKNKNFREHMQPITSCIYIWVDTYKLGQEMQTPPEFVKNNRIIKLK